MSRVDPETREARNAQKKLRKLQKDLGHDVREELDAMGGDDLRSVIVVAEQSIAETQTDQENDDDLAKVKDRVSYLETPYKEAIKAQRAKIAYAVFRLAERGEG